MDKLYLVIIDQYENEENSIVNICTSREVAVKLMTEYLNRTHDVNFNYHIDEVPLDFSKDILWDCYNNSSFCCD